MSTPTASLEEKALPEVSQPKEVATSILDEKPPLSPDTEDSTGFEINTAAENKLVWKIDIHLMPILFLLYMFAFLDRVNIGNARIQGLLQELHMSGTDYNVASMILFVPYILLEVPSNLIIKRIRPSHWLGGLMFCWGLVSMCQGFVSSYGGLLACRVLLGAFEAGVFPGKLLYTSHCGLPILTNSRCCLSHWHVLQKVRISKAIGLVLLIFNIVWCFWWCESLSNPYVSAYTDSLFSFLRMRLRSLMAKVAIQDGAGKDFCSKYKQDSLMISIRIFIIEGLATSVVAIVSFFAIADWPEQASFLNQEEKDLIAHRLANDGNSGVARMDTLNKPALKRIFGDWKIWCG